MTDQSVADLSTTLRPLHHHEDLLAAAASTIRWPMTD
jgi:fatty-acyl-CoA synthase